MKTIVIFQTNTLMLGKELSQLREVQSNIANIEFLTDLV